MDWVLIKLVFYHYADKMYFLLLLWGNQENHIFWRFWPVKLMLKFVLYGVPDHSALIFKFVSFAIVLVALPQGKKYKSKCRRLCFAGAWKWGRRLTSREPTCRFLGFCEAPQMPRNLLFRTCHLVCSHDVIDRLVVPSLWRPKRLLGLFESVFAPILPLRLE